MEVGDSGAQADIIRMMMQRDLRQALGMVLGLLSPGISTHSLVSLRAGLRRWTHSDGTYVGCASSRLPTRRIWEICSRGL